MAERIRVYVAGAYSGPDVMTIFNNMRRGMKFGKELVLDGYAPFVPWFDYHFQLLLDVGERLFLEDYYEYSMAWLEGSHVVCVVPHESSKKSTGTRKEIVRADIVGIPVTWGKAELDYWRDNVYKNEKNVQNS